jgi:serine/threonine-protein kinase RsbW
MPPAAAPAPSAGRSAVAHYEHGPGTTPQEVWIEALEALAVRIGSAGGLHADAACFLGVALREAVMNALHHGAGGGGPRVTVGFAVTSAREVLFTVRDHGPGFDPAAVPDPLAPENLPSGHGRGILFMRRFADEVSFRFPRRGGTVARLRKALPN